VHFYPSDREAKKEILVRADRRLDYMKKIVLVCGGILVLSRTAPAQDLPKFDAFGGYSYIHFNQSQVGGNLTSNFSGGNGAVAFYPGKWLGIMGDFGSYKISSIKQGGASFDIDGSNISYLFGPRIRFGSRGVTPFAQVLFGGAHHGVLNATTAAVCAFQPTPCKITDSENAFAMTAEGGIDIKVARHFAIRGQAGYLMTRFPQGDGNGNQTRQTQNNARVSVGIVVH